MKQPMRQLALLAVAALSLTLSNGLLAATCSTTDLTTSTQCLTDVSTGQGGNVTETMMNSYASNAGAFGVTGWVEVATIESFNQNSAAEQKSTPDVFSFTSTNSGKTGTWTGTFEAGYSYAFVLKGGKDSAVYLMNTAMESGTWSTSGLDNSAALSNVRLFRTSAAVPLPAAAWLFGSALLGMAGLGYGRRSHKS